MKDQDLIRRKMVAILRLANQSAQEDDPYETYSDYHIQNDELLEVIENLSPKEKNVMASVIMSYTLLTSGTVSIVRDPSSYGDSKYGEIPQLKDIMSPPFRQIFFTMNKRIPKVATQEDYEMAHKLLPIIGSESVEWHDLPDELVGGYSDSIKGPDQTWRGMTNLDSRLLMGALRPNASWNIERGVSTSTDRDTARDTFAGIREVEPGVFDSNSLFYGGGSSMLLRFINKKGVGAIVQKLSSFPQENEVILSGVGTIKNWSLQFVAIEEGAAKGPVRAQIASRAVLHISLNNLPDKSNIEIRRYATGDNITGNLERTIDSTPRDVYRIARTIVTQGFSRSGLIDGVGDFVGDGKNKPGFIMTVDVEIS